MSDTSLRREGQSKWALWLAIGSLILGLIFIGLVLFDHGNAAWIYLAVAAFLASMMLGTCTLVHSDNTRIRGWAAVVAIIGMALASIFGLIIRLSFNIFYPL